MKIRKRFPVVSVLGIVFVAVLTIGNAAANVVSTFKLPTTAELQREEQADRTAERKAHLAALQAAGDRCRPAVAHELAEALVMDGQPADRYAADYARRCGDDPIVAKWGSVSPKIFATLAALRSRAPARPAR